MAEGDITFYAGGKEFLLDNDGWVGTTTVRLMLLSAYTPSTAHTTMTAVLAAGTEESGTGYTADGEAVTTRATTVSGANVNLTAENVTWTGLDVGTPAYAVCYEDDAGGDGSSTPLFYMELGTTASNGGDYTIDWSGAGIVATLS